MIRSPNFFLITQRTFHLFGYTIFLCCGSFQYRAQAHNTHIRHVSSCLFIWIFGGRDHTRIWSTKLNGRTKKNYLSDSCGKNEKDFHTVFFHSVAISFPCRNSFEIRTFYERGINSNWFGEQSIYNNVFNHFPWFRVM